LEVNPLKYTEIDQIEDLITHFQFKPFYYYNIDNLKLSKYFLYSLKKEDAILTVKKNKKILGAAILVDLPWDSNLFGIKMAKISYVLTKKTAPFPMDIVDRLISAVLDLCKERNIQHISCHVDSKNTFFIHRLEEKGFHLMDTMVIYSISLKDQDMETEVTNQSFIERKAEKKDLSEMQELAGKAFINPNIFLSRFYIDPLLRKNAGKLYREWLKNSLMGEQADIVFIAESDNKPIGFITCLLPEKKSVEILNKRIGTIPLNATSSEFRGQGVYNQLLKHSLNWFRKQDVDFVEIKTQIITLPVQRAWQKLGGTLVSSYHTLHKEI